MKSMSGAASRSLSMVRKRQRGKSRPSTMDKYVLIAKRAHYHGNRKSLKRDSDPKAKASERVNL